VWFYPYTPRLSGWALKAERPDSDNILAVVPKDVDILATHGPPLGAGDSIPPTSRFNTTGCIPCASVTTRLTAAIPRIDPKLVLCGHIHEGRGEEKLPGSDHLIVNVSALDDNYEMYPNPFVDLTPYLAGGGSA
jgi:Icc-related predicted phosphoesterase